MSTASEWERVLELTLACGVVSLVSSVVTKRKPSATFLHFAEMAFFGLFLGMTMVFQWRVLRAGIVPVFAAAVLGIFAVGLIDRRRGKAQNHLSKP